MDGVNKFARSPLPSPSPCTPHHVESKIQDVLYVRASQATAHDKKASNAMTQATSIVKIQSISYQLLTSISLYVVFNMRYSKRQGLLTQTPDVEEI